MAAIKNFYETAVNQPPIPGAVLLFTPESLKFQAMGKMERVGDLPEPEEGAAPPGAYTCC